MARSSPLPLAGVRLVPIALVIAMTTLLLIPDPWGMVGELRQFKSSIGRGYAVHFGVYLLLGLCVAATFSTVRARQFCFVALCAHAAITEAAQLAIPGRDADVWDLAANLAGVAASALLLKQSRDRSPRLFRRRIAEQSAR